MLKMTEYTPDKPLDKNTAHSRFLSDIRIVKNKSTSQ